MKKVIKGRWFLFAAFLSISISAFAFVAYKKAQTLSIPENGSCQQIQMNNNSSEMLWDILSRQFVSSVSTH